MTNTTVPAEAQSGVTAISAGAGFSLALKNGAVIAWGDNFYGQLDIPAEAHCGASAISCGYVCMVLI
ncbi:RCC1 domain-containing protein [Nonomuraea sp. NPDC050680]|uniref:RCC1 domain-containing protein n=1 Tax=Nonomuraea sp. NPDC050680 TaxID=3154630 RepID=UPI0033C14C3F